MSHQTTTARRNEKLRLVPVRPSQKTDCGDGTCGCGCGGPLGADGTCSCGCGQQNAKP